MGKKLSLTPSVFKFLGLSALILAFMLGLSPTSPAMEETDPPALVEEVEAGDDPEVKIEDSGAPNNCVENDERPACQVKPRGLGSIPIKIKSESQIQQLQRQVAVLQNELRAMKAIVNLSRDGTTHIRAKKNKQEITGGNERVEIGAHHQTAVGRSLSQTVGTTHSIKVGTNQSTMIGGDMTLKVGKNLRENATIDVNVAAGKRAVITAGDQLILKTGRASIVLKKNGEILFNGKNIAIKGSGPVIFKGSKVPTN